MVDQQRREQQHLTAYDAFARVFTQFNSLHSVGGSHQVQLDAVVERDVGLDQDQGLVVNVAAVLGDLIRSFPDPQQSESWTSSGIDTLPEDEVEALLLEHRTWELLHVVLSDQLLEHEPQASPKEAVASEPYITQNQLTQYIVSSDPELRLWCTLLEHLQSRPILASAPPLEARKGYLPYTLRKHKAAIRAGKTGLPKSLDPDFPLRTDASLAGEDATYERPLFETLFGHVRHGELDLALDVLRASDESWRAASLQGGTLWSMNAEDRNGEKLSGNRNRRLWKKTCRAIANNSRLSLHERALYGSIVGHLPSTLPACHSWEDHLWAEIQARVEARLEALYKETGGFWYQQLAIGGNDEDDALEGGLEHVFARIEKTERDGVADSARNPYRFAQKMIILGKTDILLDQFAEQLDGLQDRVSSNLIPLLLRFFAHLVLALRSLSVIVPTNAANAIIEAYVRVLEAEGRNELVAMYAACLREGSGEESYARFLRAMDPTASRAERQQALARAAEHHLDVARIAGITVNLILSEPFLAMPPLDADEPEIVLSSLELSDRDITLIRSIEWLTMTNETYDQALIASNALARYYLTSGQTHIARKLFETLPADFLDAQDMDMDEADDRAHRAEHDQIAVIFRVLDIYQQVVQVSSREPGRNAPKMDHLNWKKSLGALVDNAHETTVALLHARWLRLSFDGNSLEDTRRRSELRRIRHIFIPDLVVRLHHLLSETRSWFPSNLQRALDLTKLVADERLHIYEEFMGSRAQPVRLRRYLDLVREASFMALA